MNLYLEFLKNNLRGVLAGMIYTLTAWLLLMLGVSFGDTCDISSEICTQFSLTRMPLFILTIPNVMVWSMLEYFVVQIPLVSILGNEVNSYLVMVNTIMIPAVFVPLTILLWATMGAATQELIRQTKHNLSVNYTNK